ncbi:MAG: NADPH-dependent F420 reductase, partial [Terriglobia bacterium]
MRTNLTIAVLGAGNVGGALGRLWASAGHEVRFGVPHPRGERVVAAVAAMPGRVRAHLNAEAVSPSDVVALCVPWPAAEDAIRSSGDLDGKILIDCTNPRAPDLNGLTVGLATSAAELVASWAPGAKVVKAFNTVGAAVFGNAQFGPQRADGF